MTATAPAPAVDPVFALIARHRALSAAWCVATGDLPFAESVAYEEANPGQNAAVDAAWQDFVGTPPTTIAGLRASLAYAIETDSDGVSDACRALAPTLLRSPLFTAGRRPR